MVKIGAPRSIQGEQQERTQADLYASPEQVDAYVATADPGMLACRQGQHAFPRTQRGGDMTFHGVTAENFLVRRIPCDRCRHPQTGAVRVVRVEEWDIRFKKRTGEVLRADLFRATTKYLDRTYLNKTGYGRIKPRQISGSIATTELSGQDFRKLKKEAMALITAGREVEQLTTMEEPTTAEEQAAVSDTA